MHRTVGLVGRSAYVSLIDVRHRAVASRSDRNGSVARSTMSQLQCGIGFASSRFNAPLDTG